MLRERLCLLSMLLLLLLLSLLRLASGMVFPSVVVATLSVIHAMDDDALHALFQAEAATEIPGHGKVREIERRLASRLLEEVSQK